MHVRASYVVLRMVNSNFSFSLVVSLLDRFSFLYVCPTTTLVFDWINKQK